MTRAATAYIDLDAWRHNLATIRRNAPGARILAVIKANGYGHGLIRAAKTLASAEAFAVARLEEALALRQAGVENRVILLQGFADSDELTQLARYDIETVVHHSRHLELLETAQLAKPVSVWLKIDTGMHRLGFAPETCNEVWHRLEQCRAVAKPIRAMSHFANADIAGDSFTAEQISRFVDITRSWQVERSLANSAGIFGWPPSHFDWVRPGISLYGASPFEHRSAASLNLVPVMTLCSEIVSIKSLKAGEAVGYSHLWRTNRDTYVAIVGIGYADGYPRHAQNGTPVVIAGKRYPVAGRVSMDSLCVDLGNESGVKIGDTVELWGKQVSVEEVARYASTIPYELLCKVAARVRFVEQGGA